MIASKKGNKILKKIYTKEMKHLNSENYRTLLKEINGDTH
jgi:hypothetical protein